MKPNKLPPRACSMLWLAALLATTALAAPAFAQKNNRGETRPPHHYAAQPSREVRQYTIEQFMDTTRIGGSSFSPDEREILFHSNKTGIFNVYSVSVAGGAARQLTNSTKESTYAVSYFPSDTRFIYTYD